MQKTAELPSLPLLASIIQCKVYAGQKGNLSEPRLYGNNLLRVAAVDIDIYNCDQVALEIDRCFILLGDFPVSLYAKLLLFKPTYMFFVKFSRSLHLNICIHLLDFGSHTMAIHRDTPKAH